MPSYLAKSYGEAGRLGAGSFGSVVRVYDEESGAALAAKIFEADGGDDSEEEEEEEAGTGSGVTADALRELSFMALLTDANAPHLAPLHDFAFELSTQRGLVAFMPLFSRDLGRAIDGADLRQSQRLAVARDLFSALAYLHGACPAIVHRDVKPENILLDGGNAAFLTDLSFARFVDADEEPRRRRGQGGGGGGRDPPGSGVVGTPTYIAPEVFLGARSRPAVDCWSAGVVLLELFQHRRLPVDRDKAALRLVRQARDAMCAERPLPRLLRELLAEEPGARLGAAQALASSALAGPEAPAGAPPAAAAPLRFFEEAPAPPPDRALAALCRRLLASEPRTCAAAQRYHASFRSGDPRLLCIVAYKLHEPEPASDGELLARLGCGGLGAELAETQEQLLRLLRGCLLAPFAPPAEVVARTSSTKISR